MLQNAVLQLQFVEVKDSQCHLYSNLSVGTYSLSSQVKYINPQTVKDAYLFLEFLSHLSYSKITYILSKISNCSMHPKG